MLIRKLCCRTTKRLFMEEELEEKEIKDAVTEQLEAIEKGIKNLSDMLDQNVAVAYHQNLKLFNTIPFGEGTIVFMKTKKEEKKEEKEEEKQQS